MAKSGVNAVAEVTDRLRADIVGGVFGPGDRLKLDLLATRYGVGHMPLREALRRLEGEDLVASAPNRGARVRSVDAAFVANLFDIRIALESMLARRAAEHIEATELDEVSRIHRRHQKAVRDRDWPAALQANRDFHAAINAASRNPLAAQLLDRHWQLLAGLWQRYGFVAQRFAVVVDDHDRILDALASRDGDSAAGFATAHTARARQHLLAQMVGRLLQPAAAGAADGVAG